MSATEVYKSKKSKKQGDDINLTVYINIVDENSVSPEQRRAIEQVREMVVTWIEEE